MTDEPSPSQPAAAKDGEPPSIISRLMRLFSGRSGEGSLRESIEEVLEEHAGEGDQDLGAEEHELLMKTLAFADLRVEDIMVPRADIIAADAATSFADLVQCFAEAEVSRMPIYRGSLDEVIFMVHIKDLFRVLAESRVQDGLPDSGAAVQLADIQRPILFVPPSMRLPNLLLKMRATRIHMAVVVDEYGGTDGVVTIEDLVEQIVGDIEDEHDTDGPDTDMLTAIDACTYEAGARLDVEDLEKALDRKLRTSEELEDVDSVGGLVTAIAGRVPQKGEIVQNGHGLSFEVLEADPRRLKKLRVRVEESIADDG